MGEYRYNMSKGKMEYIPDGNIAGPWSEEAVDSHQLPNSNMTNLTQSYSPSGTYSGLSTLGGFGTASSNMLADSLKGSTDALNVSEAGGAVNTTPKLSPYDDYWKKKTDLLDKPNDPWSMQGAGGLALGGFQTGVSLLGTLDQMKTAKLQRNLLNQQYQTNAEKMDHWKASNAGVENAFRGGLAASGVK